MPDPDIEEVEEEGAPDELDLKKTGIPVAELRIGAATFRYNNKTQKLELWVQKTKQDEWP